MLTAKRARELINYNPATGTFRWKVSRPNARAGELAGSTRPSGYRALGVEGRLYRAHRLAWLIVHGAWPLGEIDHANGDRADNRLDNLRIATRAQNVHNAPCHPTNVSGLKGVSYHKPRSVWRARIRHSGRRLFLGYFTTPEAAHAAYASAAQRIFGEFARPT